MLALFLAILSDLAAGQEVSVPTTQVIVITGSRSARPLDDTVLSVQVKDRKEMEQAGARNAAEALSAMPGLQVREGLRGQVVTIQGLAGRHVLILVDGERPSGFTDGNFDLTRIPTDQIARIEVVKGAASALYGSDAIGGVVNIITRHPRDGVNGAVTFSQDSRQARESAALLNTGNEHTRASVEVSKQVAPAVDLDAAHVDTNLSAYDVTRATMRVRQSFNRHVALGLRSTIENQRLSGVSVTGGGAVLDTLTLTRTETMAVEPILTEDSGAEWRLKANQSRTRDRFEEDQRHASVLDREERSQEKVSEWSLIHARDLNASHRLTAGVDVLAQSLESDRLREKAGERERRGAFVQYEWTLGTERPLVMAPGLRVDDDSQFGERFSPKLALRWDPASQTIVRASYGKGYRAPDFKELFLKFENPQVGYRVEGNPHLEPEEAESFAANAEWTPSASWWLNLGVFHNNVHNLITTTTAATEGPGTLVYSYVNAARARTRGVEASARYALNAQWRLGLDYAFLEAKDLDTNRTLAGRAQHTGAAQIGYTQRESGFSGHLEWQAVGMRPFYPDSGNSLATTWARPYRNVSLRLAKDLNETFQVFAGGRNLTDEVDPMYHAVPHRTYFGGVKASF